LPRPFSLENFRFSLEKWSVVAPDGWSASYEVTRAAVLSYCSAIGETHPLHTDPDAARAAGFPDLVAPPMFAAVYSLPAVRLLQRDPAAGLGTQGVVHGGQTFRWNRRAPVVAGDTLHTTARLSRVYDKGRLRLFEFETRSRRHDGAEVAQGLWTAIRAAG
jgi:acyl dehydratase